MSAGRVERKHKFLKNWKCNFQGNGSGLFDQLKIIQQIRFCAEWIQPENWRVREGDGVETNQAICPSGKSGDARSGHEQP
jgi:hypothetical protein